METGQPRAILQSHTDQLNLWHEYTGYCGEVCCTVLENISQALDSVQERVENERCFAVGFVSYEAAPGFDPAFKTNALTEHFPYLYFAFFKDRKIFNFPARAEEVVPNLPWSADTSAAEYENAIAGLQSHISGGETYQVNYTYRLNASTQIDPYSLFKKLVVAQHSRYGGFLDTEKFSLCSASPELFFSLTGEDIHCMPMKGTIKRGETPASDQENANALLSSGKERSENVMIVDMTRNDLSRIADRGHVQTTDLCQISPFANVWQMTSTVRTKTSASLSEIFGALFPAASITGAPKVRTMEIISKYEKSPRKTYCGAFGLVAPERECRFNVAIRSVLYDKRTKELEFGVGSGVTSESRGVSEYAECESKASILFIEDAGSPEFGLLETLLWTKGDGFFLLDEHISRMRSSASFFQIPFSENLFRKTLSDEISRWHNNEHSASLKVRIVLSSSGVFSSQSEEIAQMSALTVDELLALEDDCEQKMIVPVLLAESPVSKDNIYLYHKTINRSLYDAFTIPEGLHDILLWNEQGELTESTVSNILLRKDGKLFTPALSSGLLSGTYRQYLLDRGKIQEEVIKLDELEHFEALYLVNSVRGIREVRLCKEAVGVRDVA